MIESDFFEGSGPPFEGSGPPFEGSVPPFDLAEPYIFSKPIPELRPREERTTDGH